MTRIESFKIQKENVQDMNELTSMQEGMLVQHMKDPESSIYFEQLYLEIFQHVDFKIFFETWKVIIKENEILRTVFRFENIKRPVQITLKSVDFDSIIFYEDCTGQDTGYLLEKDRKNKFDLRKISFRVKLYKIAESHFVVMISNHHILYDGWSTSILLKEFITQYEKILRSIPLKVFKKTNFKEFIKLSNCKSKDKDVAYWQSYMECITQFTEIPAVDVHSQIESSVGEVSLKIDLTKTSCFLRENKLTVAHLIYSIWGILLWQYNNCENVVFGTTVSGREVDINHIENMVGLFINTIPLKVAPKMNDKIID